MILCEVQDAQNILFFRNKQYTQKAYIEIFNEVNKELGNILNEKIELREYQKEALGRFFYYYEDKKMPLENAIHLLFNAATGSGKTVLMAYIMYYLNNVGSQENIYSNVIFLVHSTAILNKTKANFIDKSSSKYLFKKDSNLKVNVVDSFTDKNKKGVLNIKFTTIQGLVSELYNIKENAITFEDFKAYKVLILADEAHHLNAVTKDKKRVEKLSKALDVIENCKQTYLNFVTKYRNSDKLDALKGLEKEEKISWERCVLRLLNTNTENILLEFTATIGIDKDVIQKYKDKLIFRYDLIRFRKDKYTKEIELAQLTDNEDNNYKDRILLALINNLYRQQLFESIKYSVCPVILFKSNTKANNKKMYDDFLERCKKFNIEELKEFINKYKDQQEFSNGLNEKISELGGLSKVVEKIKLLFNENTCKIVDSDNKNQDLIFLEKLDEKGNQIRAVFQVDMLNEGWDVLCLYDIVRLHDGRSNVKTKNGVKKIKVGPQTVSEAQLIGRGARYCPFYKKGEEHLKYIRKYDNDAGNKLRLLETLYYYSNNDNNYVNELKQALKDEGLRDDNSDKVLIPIKLKKEIKEHVKTTNLKIYVNSYEKSSKRLNIEDVRNILEKQDDIRFYGEITYSESNLDEETAISKKVLQPCKLKDVVKGDVIMYKAIRKHEFYTYENLIKYLKINTVEELVQLLKLISLKVHNKKLEVTEQLNLVRGVLDVIKIGIVKECELRSQKVFRPKNFLDIFKEEQVLSREGDTNEVEVADSWFSHDKLVGTSLEHKLVDDFRDVLKSDEYFKNYKDCYLIRNECELTIYNKEGKAFNPDFVLIYNAGTKGNMKQNMVQIFLEPKGEHLRKHDEWKEVFLKEINGTKIESEQYIYHLIGTNFFTEKSGHDYWLQCKL